MLAVSTKFAAEVAKAWKEENASMLELAVATAARVQRIPALMLFNVAVPPKLVPIV